MPSASRWKRRLVRNASPSPANIRVGSSFSRLNANTPAVNGKLPGTFSFNCQRRISPSSSNFGSATLRILRAGQRRRRRARCGFPCRGSSRRIRRRRRRPCVFGHMSSSFFARGSSCASRCRRVERVERRPTSFSCSSAPRASPLASPAIAAAARARRAAAAARARPVCVGHCSRARSRRSRRDSARAPAARSTCCAGRMPASSTGGSVPGASFSPLCGKLRDERLIQRGDAVVVEARRDRAEHRHLVGRRLEQLAVALVLLAHVAQRVLRALAVELVDGDEVGEVEHVDLLELRRGAELGRHHVQRDVDQRHDRRVALADAGGLDDRPGRSPRPCTRRSRRAAPC